MAETGSLLVVVFAVLAAVLPARTQTVDENRARCFSTDPAAKIAGCTALIDGKQVAGGELAEAYNNRGVAYEASYQREQAIADFTAAVTLRPDYANAFYNRALSYDKWNLPNRAIADLNTAIALRPGYVDAWLKQAWLYLTNNHSDWAIDDFTKVIQLKPDSTEALVGRAYAYHGKHMRDEAVADYRAALKIDPNLESAKTGLANEGALPAGGAQEAASTLPGSTWSRSDLLCEIQEIEFHAGNEARIKRAWDFAGARWSLAGDQIQFEFNDWDARLAGPLVTADDLDLTFEWKTTDQQGHLQKCKFFRKK